MDARHHIRSRGAAAGFGLTLLLAACGGSKPAVQTAETEPQAEQQPQVPPPPEKEAPPDSGPVRDVQFPDLQKAELESGLGIDVVQSDDLPLAQLYLVLNSGSASDPEELPGVAALVGEMLKQGTKQKSAAQFAEAVEFLGAQLEVYTGKETTYVSMKVLSEYLDEALALMSEAVLRPAFRPQELKKLRTREINRLKLSQNEASYLARREFHRVLYGEHPYAQIDTTVPALKKIKRGDLVRWHRQHVVPNNAFLVVVGNVGLEEVEKVSKEAFARWKPGKVPEADYPDPPERDARSILVVDRPESVQSVIYVGHLGIKRSADDFLPLEVANQVLGGSAASRLFMDLREKRSLTYGAYSRLAETVDVGTFRASAAVRNAVTGEAVSAFLEHLKRISTEPVPPEELAAAQRFLADSFPLKIETAARVADLVADLRVFGLPDDYWDTYRSAIRDVSAQQAHAAAEEHIRPDDALILVVGRAADIVPQLRQFGSVSVIDAEGEPVAGFEAEGDAQGPQATAAEEGAKPAGKKAGKDEPARKEQPAAEPASGQGAGE